MTTILILQNFFNLQRQLSNFVNRGPSTTPMTSRRTTTISTTTTTTTQKPTTAKIPTSTYSDADDLAFLNSLV